MRWLPVVAAAGLVAGCVGPQVEVPPRPANLPDTYQTLVTPPDPGRTPPRSPEERARLEQELLRQAMTPP